jgi:hypothetical protein
MAIIILGNNIALRYSYNMILQPGEYWPTGISGKSR